MIKIIEKLSENPIKLVFSGGLNNLEPGLIIKINSGFAQICNGKNPFGIVGDYYDEFGLIPIWYENMIFETDMFEKDNYKNNDKLYCSLNGKFTKNKVFENSLLMGHVINIKQNHLIIELI